MKQKKYKLRIIVYGRTALDDIRSIYKSLKKEEYSEVCKYRVKYFETIDKEKNFEYNIFQTNISEEGNESIKNLLLNNSKKENFFEVEDEIKNYIKSKFYDSNIEELNEKISEILTKVRTFYDVLVIIIDNLLDEDSKLAFKFFQEFPNNKIQQPFILFLTKKEEKPKILDLFQFITNKFFDKRNAFAFNYPNNSEETEKINTFFKKCFNYYNEIDNININQPKKTFDILLCGPKGSGKSTFVNIFLEEKVAKEREGVFGTFKTKSYIHPKFPIRIFDTPGWDYDGYGKIFLKLLKNDSFIENINYHFDLILIFIELNDNHLNSMDINYIKYLVEKRKKIIFVLNDFETHKKEKINKFISLIEDSILKIIPPNERFQMKIDEIHNNTVIVKLQQSLIEYEDEYEYDEEYKMIIKQCYGMDHLFGKIYEIFQIQKISFYQIDFSKDVNQFRSNIEKNELIKNVVQIEDILVNMKIKCSELILSYSKEDFYVLLLKDKRRKELLFKINEIFGGKIIKDIENLYSEINDEINHLYLENKKRDNSRIL